MATPKKETTKPAKASKFCSNCGTKLTAAAKFCPNCGQVVGGASLAAAAAPAAPEGPPQKKPFLVRWGNLIFLFLALPAFALALSFLTASKLTGARLFLGWVYVILAGLIFILSIVRLVKKHHRVLPCFWMLLALVLLFFAPGILGDPKSNKGSEPVVTSLHQDMACPVQVKDRSKEDSSGQDASYVEETTYFNYAVSGETRTAVRAEINRCRPPAESGQDAYDGLTRYNVVPHISPRFVDGQCAPNRVKVRAVIDVYVPKLTTSNEALRAEFATYHQNLTTHEEGHRQLVSAAAKELEKTLWELKASSCEEVQKLYAEKVQRGFQDLAEKNRVYDAETNHGATQGAVF